MLDAPAVASAVARTWWHAQRVTGMCGAGFVVIVVIQNVVLTSAMPQPDAALTEVSSYYAEHQGRVSVAVALAVINFALLLRFASGFFDRLRMTTAAETPWPRVGVLGAVLLAAFFGVVTMAQAVLVANAETLGENPSVTQMLWDLHNAAFSINSAALGIALGGFARAGQLGRLTPSWLAYPAFAGALGLLMSAAFTVEVLDGSPVAFLGLFGFLVWLVWLAATSLRLLRFPA